MIAAFAFRRIADMLARKRCAYLTMNDRSAFVNDADGTLPAMAALGWKVDYVSWRRQGVDWDDYAMVYVCTPWDYQDDPEAYLRALERIDQSTAFLVNPLDTIRWNLDKRYLRELEQRGTAIVPSLWFERWSGDLPGAALAAFATERVVLKPQVGANADFTYVLDAGTPETTLGELAQAFAERPFFVQPFLNAIQTEGEYSLFYFGGEYSHAILKTPEPGDFRSQEEHGAEIVRADADNGLKALAEAVLTALSPSPVYARADFVRGPDDGFLLMELELNEPSLYFRVDPESPARFAAALDAAFEASR